MLKKTMLALAMTTAAAGVQAQSIEELQKQIDILASEVESLKQGGASDALDNLYIGGYGEHHYNNYRDTEAGRQKDDQVDAHRFVLYVGYDFNEQVRFFSELEIEHGYVYDTNDGSGDEAPGAVELEQAYIEIETSASTRVKVGQFLVPVGIINETHEPDTFYGVERNRLESAIIPTTWWETGVWLTQDLGGGLSYDLAFHSGLEVEQNYSIRSGRQKSAKAVANDGAWTARLRYVGLPNLDLGLTAQRQNDLHQSAANGALGFAANADVPDANADLVEAHARYTAGGLQLTAMAAQWDIDSDEAKAAGKDEQKGYLLEAGYKVTDKVGVFGRHVNYDNSAGSANATDTEVLVNTFGVNYWVHPQVVLKADYDNLTYKDPAKDDDKDDAVNLGVGWSF